MLSISNKNSSMTFIKKTAIQKEEYMDGIAHNYIGKTYSRLTIIKLFRDEKTRRLKCMATCICGVTKSYQVCHIISGATISCGCALTEMHEKRKANSSKRSPLYSRWKSMISRCHNPNFTHYKHYGAKGISVCHEWRTNFRAYEKWCMDNGWEKGLEVDRYPNRLGNYCPENCRIVTSKVNMNNRDDNRIIEISGEQLTLSQASDKYNINYNTLQSRLRYGWDSEKAISKKIRPQNHLPYKGRLAK